MCVGALIRRRQFLLWGPLKLGLDSGWRSMAVRLPPGKRNWSFPMVAKREWDGVGRLEGRGRGGGSMKGSTLCIRVLQG